ncbi:MAG: uroporphyrinogen decarboxylase family protein, partial [Acidimicrobiia bacterium]
FDSWAGTVSPAAYERHVMPASAKVFAAVADLDVPAIHFGVTTGELLPLLAKAGASVVGVDWRVPLDEARSRLGPDVAVQGNLDPAVCLAPWPAVAEAATDVLVRNGGRPGHIFNLGHGILPGTPPESVAFVTDLVHERTVRR